MLDWSAVASVATAGGTLVVAVATFAAVRSGNRTAKLTERSMLASIRPVLAPTRLDDPTQKVMFGDEHWMRLDGGLGAAEVGDLAVYLAMGLRNVGQGMAVLRAWRVSAGLVRTREQPDPDTFQLQTRDFYIPSGDLGYWQGALRDPDEAHFADIRDAIKDNGTLTVDVLYGDQEGGQRVISRFTMVEVYEGRRLVNVTRHWNLDRPDPR